LNVLVLGGAGPMAKSAVWDLTQAEVIDKIIIGDVNIERAVKLARDIGADKIDVKEIDINNHQKLVEVVKEADIVANAAPYQFNMPIMKACLEGGAHYLDLGGLYHVTLDQLKLKEDFKKAKLTAILCVGASPGMVNVCVGKARELLDNIREVHIRTGARGGARGFAYSAKTIIDEVTMKPAVYKNKKMEFVEPLSGREKYVLPEPVGEVEGVLSIHSELATLPGYFDSIENITFRVAFSSRLVSIIESLIQLRLISEDTVEIDGKHIPIKEVLFKYLAGLPEPEYSDEHKAFRVEVSGDKNGDSRTYLFETLVASEPDRELRATSIWTGVPMSVAAIMIAEGVISDKGVFAPEAVIPPDYFFRELEKRNIPIYIRPAD